MLPTQGQDQKGSDTDAGGSNMRLTYGKHHRHGQRIMQENYGQGMILILTQNQVLGQTLRKSSETAAERDLGLGAELQANSDTGKESESGDERQWIWVKDKLCD